LLRETKLAGHQKLLDHEHVHPTHNSLLQRYSSVSESWAVQRN